MLKAALVHSLLYLHHYIQPVCELTYLSGAKNTKYGEH